MITTRCRVSITAASAALLLTACSPATDETPASSESADGAAASSEPATFETRPDIRFRFEAAPRLVGDTPGIVAINADLDRIDADSEGCEGEYTRTFARPMTGPGYVTYAIVDDYFCEGAAHPDTDRSVITYDLTTGRRISWATVAPGFAATGGDVDEDHASRQPAIESAALVDWYADQMLASSDAEWLNECRDLFSPEMRSQNPFFQVWLDAEAGGVVAQVEMPRVVASCARPATMSPEDMRGFGVPDAMVQAVVAGHAAGYFMPSR